MRCVCCDHLLDDMDTTAKFLESGAYVDMCRKCRTFLPRNLNVVTRSDLERKDREEEDSDIVDKYVEDDDGYEEWN
jgi:hypothetical protein